MKRKIVSFSSALLLGIAIGVAITVRLNFFSPVQSQETTSPSLEGFKMEDAVVNVANTTGKAVVSISTEHTTKIKGAKKYYFGSPFGGESPF